jgi:hypothetical protein
MQQQASSIIQTPYMRGTSTSTFHIHIHIHRPSSSRSLQAAAAEARQAQARWLARDEIGIRYPVTPTLFVHSLNLFATVREQLLRTVRETECGPINNRHMHPLQSSICITKKKMFPTGLPLRSPFPATENFVNVSPLR